MGPLLLALLGALPTGRIARAELTLTIDLAHDSAIGRLPATAAVGGNSLDATSGFRLFLDGVRDDATPIALQPFLQRTSSLAVAAGFGYVDAPSSIATALLGDLAASARRGRFAVAGEVFVTRSLALTLSSGYRVEIAAPADSPTVRRDTIPWSAGIALRAGDLRFAVTLDGFYRRTDTRAASSDETHLRALFDLRAVLVNHIDLGVSAAAFDHGGDAGAHIDYYPSRSLGLLTRVYGGKQSRAPFPDGGNAFALGSHDPIAAPGAHLGFWIGMSYWLRGAFGVTAHYGAAWIEGLAAGATDQRLVLSVAGRVGN